MTALLSILIILAHASSEPPIDTLTPDEFAKLQAQQQYIYGQQLRTIWNPFRSFDSSLWTQMSSLTTTNYPSIRNRANKMYSAKCQSSTQACTSIKSGLSELTGVARSSLSSSFRAPLPLTPSSCKKAFDGEGKRLYMAPVGLTKDYQCLFDGNVFLLKKVADFGCQEFNPKTMPGGELFISTFEGAPGTNLLGPTNVLEGIIENVVEENGYFLVQMLRPNLSTTPVSLERITFKARGSGKDYEIQLPSGQHVKATMKNNNRKNFFRFASVKGSAMNAGEKDTYDRYADASIMMASNCKLSQQLQSLGLYHGTAPASSGKNSKGEKGSN